MAESAQTTIPIVIDEELLTQMDTTIVIPTPETHVSILDDKAILLNLDTGAYHALNAMGTNIWELFIPERTLSHILLELCANYDVTEVMAQEDLLELVTRLRQAGLVRLEKN